MLTVVDVGRVLISSVFVAEASTSTSGDDEVALYSCVPGPKKSWNALKSA